VLGHRWPCTVALFEQQATPVPLTFEHLPFIRLPTLTLLYSPFVRLLANIGRVSCKLQGIERGVN
jgi:hypothetical protein